LLAEQIGPNKGAGGRQRRARIGSGECGGERQLRAITEDGRRTQQIGRLGRETSEARRDAIRDCTWTEPEDLRRVLGGRCETLPPDCVEQRDQVERVATRTSLEGGRERRRGLVAEPLAREHRGRLPAQTAWPHHHAAGIGEKLPDER